MLRAWRSWTRSVTGDMDEYPNLHETLFLAALASTAVNVIAATAFLVHNRHTLSKETAHVALLCAFFAQELLQGYYIMFVVGPWLDDDLGAWASWSAFSAFVVFGATTPRYTTSSCCSVLGNVVAEFAFWFVVVGGGGGAWRVSTPSIMAANKLVLAFVMFVWANSQETTGERRGVCLHVLGVLVPETAVLGHSLLAAYTVADGPFRSGAYIGIEVFFHSFLTMWWLEEPVLKCVRVFSFRQSVVALTVFQAVQGLTGAYAIVEALATGKGGALPVYDWVVYGVFASELGKVYLSRKVFFSTSSTPNDTGYNDGVGLAPMA